MPALASVRLLAARREATRAARAPASVSMPAALTARNVLALQASAGNGAVARLLRQPAPVAAGKTTLRAARFADNDRLQRAANNNPPLLLGEENDAVARIQRAFLDLGYKLPRSTRSGWPDGQYGDETRTAVRRFQTENGVPHPSGHEAGKRTLTKLDEVFVKRDAALELPPALKEVALLSTRPAIERPDNTVTKPEAKVTPTSVAAGPEAEHEHRGQIEISGGLSGELHLGRKPPEDEPPNFFCDHAKVQVDIKGNINVIKLGDRVTLLPNVGLGFNLAPSACGKAPGVEAHVDLLKLKLRETVELGVMTSFEPKNIGLTGWIAKGGITFEAKPFKGVPLSVGVDGAAGVQRIPFGPFGNFFWFLEGGVSAKVEFGFF